MAQSNESNHSFDSINETVKRKRGRPRKERIKAPRTGFQFVSMMTEFGRRIKLLVRRTRHEKCICMCDGSRRRCRLVRRGCTAVQRRGVQCGGMSTWKEWHVLWLNFEGTQANSRTQRRRDNSLPASRTTNNSVNDDLVGKEISGTLEGSFDSGHLLTIRVNGTLLRGMVFDSRVAVPITASNDVAPNLKMLKREEFLCPAPISAEPLQSREPLITKAPNNDSVQCSPVLNSNVEEAAKVQLSDGQTLGVTANEVIGEKKSELSNEIPSQTYVHELDRKEVVLIDNVSRKNASATVPESAATETFNPSSYSQML